MTDDVPIGILLNRGKRANEVLGLGKIISEDNHTFSIMPYAYDDAVEVELEVDAYLQGKMDSGDYSAPDSYATVVARRGQHIFRTKLLAIYDSSCAFCGFNIPTFLIAGHIAPYSKNRKNRLNPRNGILLCRLCDH